jgi:3-phosphoshikimate 1-carboxyvinyltransferase
MNIRIQNSKITHNNSSITITGSKSESNRLLILQALYPEIDIANLSNADDTKLMKSALKSIEEIIDIHHAGTAMRFLTAYFSNLKNREVILTGSERMQKRPIKILVDALRSLDADIQYLNKEGFPPIKIKGNHLLKSKVTIDANVSSQYISALLLMAPKLENGLTIVLDGEITSVPYIQMTLELLNSIGVNTSFDGNIIEVQSKTSIDHLDLVVESDWSSASYFYSLIAASEIGTKITLSSYKKNSLQGDAALTELFETFGVKTTFHNNSIEIKKEKSCSIKSFDCQLNNTPDLAQTIAVTCLLLNVDCYLTGLHTLKIKETDRLQALKNELEKFGASVTISKDELKLKSLIEFNDNVQVDTYNDHRMAMAFAPLALKTTFQMNNAEVVSKSYPDFWRDFQQLGIKISEL